MEYILMHKKTPVMELEFDDATSTIIKLGSLINLQHLPIGIHFQENGLVDLRNFWKWWTRRSIPASRSGLRDLLQTNGLPFVEELLKECYGLSLSDQYWINPKEKPLDFDKINFFDNPFSEDVGNLLFGGKASKEKLDLISPDSTSDGCLKKRWKIINGKRYLIKGGSNPFHQEPLNESLAASICNRLSIPHIEYTVMWDGDRPYSVCEDFIDSSQDLVSAFYICETKSFTKGDDLYVHFTDCCKDLGIIGVSESLNRMLVLDFLIANTDRHYGNFGAIRNAETLKWVGMAPIFDNGTSMWCSTPNAYINPDANIESMTFYQRLEDQLDLVTDFSWLKLDALVGIEDEFDELLAASPYIDEERRRFLCDALLRRIELLQSYVNQFGQSDDES